MSRGRSDTEGSTSSNRREYSLASILHNVDAAERLVRMLCERAGFTAQQCEEIGLAVRETVANAVLHGNESDPSKRVILTTEVKDYGVEVSVRDQGKGFDPNSVPDPLDPQNLLKESGRGMLMIRTLMDEVSIERSEQGMEIRMIKYLTNLSGGGAKYEHEIK